MICFEIIKIMPLFYMSTMFDHDVACEFMFVYIMNCEWRAMGMYVLSQRVFDLILEAAVQTYSAAYLVIINNVTHLLF